MVTLDSAAYKSLMMQTSHESIFVYTMGKVASSSISDAILATGTGCYDIHFLSPGQITKRIEKFFENEDLAQVPPHMIRSLQAYNALRSGKPVKIISLVREPVSRNISSVFQNLPERFSSDWDEIFARLKRNPPHWPDWWFENDFIPALGINIFEQRVNSERSVFRFRRDKVDVLFLKHDMNDLAKAKAIENFLGFPIQIDRMNDSSSKWYKDAYKTVIADPSAIGKRYVEDCLNCRYFKFFYSQSEQEAIRAKYLRGA